MMPPPTTTTLAWVGNVDSVMSGMNDNHVFC